MADKNLKAKITVDFNENPIRESINSGETINTLFGKIKKFFSDLKPISFSGSCKDLTDFPTSMPASDVYAWAKAETKPSYTKSEIGLGNVGNFKAVSTTANQGLTNTEKANARSNIGAGTSSFSGSYNDLTNIPDNLATEDDINSLESSLLDKVDKVDGKGLSSNDYTNEEKNKLNSKQNIRNGSVGLSTDWNTLTTPGAYEIQDCTMTATYHAPVGEYPWGILYVIDSAGNTGDHRLCQLYIPHIPTIHSMWIRMNNSDSGYVGWKPWAGFYTTQTPQKSITGNAATATTASNMKVPRVTKSCNVSRNQYQYKSTIEEYAAGTDYNLPSNHFYHIMTICGTDSAYATQLALGMTTTAAYYRRCDAGTWGAWKLMTDCLPLSGGTLNTDSIIKIPSSSAGRRLTISPTSVSHTAPSSSGEGWTSGFNFYKKDGTTVIGAIKAMGTGDTLKHYYLGTDYSNPIAAVTPAGNATFKGNITIPTAKSTVNSVNTLGTVPAAGAITANNLTETKNFKSFIGTVVKPSGSWFHIISTRHRNGADDGGNFGFYISTPLSGESADLIWNRQYNTSSWQGERTVLDSSNYKTYATPAKIGALSLNGGTMNSGATIKFPTNAPGRNVQFGSVGVKHVAPSNSQESWAQGLSYYKTDGTSVIGAVGAFGTGDTLNYYYFGGFANPIVKVKSNGAIKTTLSGKLLISTTTETGSISGNIPGVSNYAAFLVNLTIKATSGNSNAYYQLVLPLQHIIDASGYYPDVNLTFSDGSVKSANIACTISGDTLMLRQQVPGAGSITKMDVYNLI